MMPAAPLIALLAGPLLAAPGNLLDRAADPAAWVLELHDPARATLDRGDGGLHLHVDGAGGERWNAQIFRRDLPLTAGETYQLTMALRAEPPRELHVSIGQQAAPYDVTGFFEAVRATREWRKHEFYFTFDSATDVPSRGPLIAAGDEAGKVWVRDVVLRAAD